MYILDGFESHDLHPVPVHKVASPLSSKAIEAFSLYTVNDLPCGGEHLSFLLTLSFVTSLTSHV